MGLEAINFFFCSKEPIKKVIESNNSISIVDGKRYIYIKDNLYWIDLELQNDLCLSIRITLCNPKDSVLDALDVLLKYLFSYKGSILNNLNTKEVFNKYNESVKERIFEAYENRRKVFEGMYGDYTAAISSEEFYRRKRVDRGLEE